MAAKKDTLSNALLDAVLGNVSYSSPATLFVALYTIPPTNITQGTEVSDTGTAYVRMPVTFDAATGGETSNSSAVTWPAATGGGYGTVVGVAICTSSVVGTDDQLYYGTLDTATLISATDEANFDVGALLVTET